ncbi:MAG: HAMP domain-containing histidine kinase [Oscillospiraceae bacterium]|jgi:signal transduction histidine kinase|nr:HAMP domain-containing histidine kinase [Oscillospiraceae bacterium]
MSIKGKIFTYLLLFCAFLIALLWLFQIVFLDSIYKRVKIGEVRRAMTALTADTENLAEAAESLYRTRGISTAVFSENGEILLAAGAFPRQKDSVRELRRLYALASENGGEYLEYPFAESEPPPREPTFGAGFPSGRQQDIYRCKLVDGSLIVLSATISPVDATVGALKIELYFITGAMLLFSTGLALLIARRVSKPIVAINESAKTLARGQYDAKFNASGYREIRELAGTLNVAARELSRADGLRRELVANISHDLRTPLTLIAGYAEAMRDLPGESTPENAQIIVDEANRLNRMVGEVLDLSKLQAGAAELRPEPYSLTESLRGIVGRLSEFTKANGYRLALETDGDVTVSADESAVAQAVYNLMTNALNFTGDDKTVTVRQIAAEDTVTVEVEDSGKGVAPEELPYVWDRYYRSGKKHVRAAVGTGIGLSIVKSVVDLHGGEYGVRSSPGSGSVFWIRLKRRI